MVLKGFSLLRGQSRTLPQMIPNRALLKVVAEVLDFFFLSLFKALFPLSVMNDIMDNCLEAVTDDDQATESDEDCIAIAVEKYKKTNP